MSSLKRYLIEFIILVTVIFLYFMYTSQGKSNFYNLISYAASNKVGVNVDIQLLDLSDYPHITANALVDKVYKIHLDGYLSDLWSERKFDLTYTIDAKYLKNKDIKIKSKVRLEGTIKGKRHYVELMGSGLLLDGNISCSFIKKKKVFHDVHLELEDINSSKLAKILNQKVIFRGLAHANLYFEHIDKKSKKGKITYAVRDKDFHGHVTDFNASVEVENKKHLFAMDLFMPKLTLHLKDGIYEQEKKYAHTKYELDIKNLLEFKKELGGTYLGSFYALGEIEYDKHIKIKGLSKSLDGLLGFDYNKTLLQLELIDIPLTSILQRLGEDTISLESNTTGKILYDVEKREMDAKIVFNNTKILPSKLTKSIYKTFDYDLADEKFSKSYLNAQLQNGKLHSQIIFSNNKNHLVLNDTKIDIDKKMIDTIIDLETPKHFLKGHVQVRLDDYITDDYFLQFNGVVEKYYNVFFDGILNNKLINMDYSLNARRVPSHICTIEDNVSIKGHINGPFNNLHVRGSGTVLEGNVSYDGIKIGDTFENVSIKLENIHALKLSTLLGEPNLPSGKANVEANFTKINKKEYEGSIDYVLKDAKYKSLPLAADVHIDIHNELQTFVSKIHLGNTRIELSKGLGDNITKKYSAFFKVGTKDLSQLEGVLGEKYIGSFYAVGNVKYNKELEIRGITKTYGGIIDFLYKKDFLILDLEDTSLKSLLLLFSQKPLLDASTSGAINYDYKKKLLLVETKLKNAKFEHTDIVDSVFEKAGVNLLKETFTQSTLSARYENKILNANINLKSPTSTFILNKIRVDNNTKVINAFFYFNMQKEEFTGKIYGTINNPKINLDMQKLLKYQVDKQMDTYIGKSNRKMMESMPMGGAAKDMATDIGGGFMDLFF